MEDLLKVVVNRKQRDRRSRPKYVCATDGCTNQPAARGVCRKHGAYGICTVDGCMSTGENCSQLCNKHGARGLCILPGCTTNITSKGLCFKHGGGKRAGCKHADCNTNAVSGHSLCYKHSNKSKCLEEGCTTNAIVRGLCTKHSGYKKSTCTYAGCTTTANSKGLCKKHGGGTRKVCVHDGCTTFAQCKGLCKKHGAHGMCPEQMCTSQVQVRGRCTRHDNIFNPKQDRQDQSQMGAVVERTLATNL